jgi:hypothetical protein
MANKTMKELQEAMNDVPGLLQPNERADTSMVSLLNSINKPEEAIAEKKESAVDKMISNQDGWKDARLSYAEMLGETLPNTAMETITEESKIETPVVKEETKPVEEETNINPKRTLAALKVIKEIVTEEMTEENAQKQIEDITKILGAL